MRKAGFYLKFLLAIWVSFGSVSVFAYANNVEEESHSQDSTAHQPKKFKPGDFIFDHIGDSHEWHILTVGHTHISVPLPVILFSLHQNKLFVFMSSKFHHGHSAYKNFQLQLEGEYKGKIVELDENQQVIGLPLDFSIKKNVAAIFFSMLLMAFIFISVARKYNAFPNTAPKGMQNLMETLILFVRDDIAIPSIGEKNYLRFMPYLLTVFFFIWINNMLGLIPIFPGGANVTGNIAVTMSLALFSFFTINLNGNRHYWKDVFNSPGVPWFLKLPIPIMPFVELMGVLIKPFVLMVRLFANILAGHIVAMVLISLIFIFGAINVYFGYGISVISMLLKVFMSVLELLVAVIQAYVFTLLTALFLGMATAEHH